MQKNLGNSKKIENRSMVDKAKLVDHSSNICASCILTDVKPFCLPCQSMYACIFKIYWISFLNLCERGWNKIIFGGQFLKDH